MKETVRSVVLASLLCAAIATPQSPPSPPPDPYIQVRKAMEAAAARQKASAMRQLPQQTTQPRPDGWFSHPWPYEPLPPISWEQPQPQPSGAPTCDPLPTEQMQALVRQTARRHQLDEQLLDAIVYQESGYRPCAVSAKGAQGLMQILPATASELGLNDPFDPEQNMDAGARYLKQLIAQYQGNLPLALAAYNAGPARVDPRSPLPDIPETRAYVAAILSRLLLF